MIRKLMNKAKAIWKRRDFVKRYHRLGNEYRVFVRENHVAPLSKEQISEIDNYWKQFGVKFDDYSFFQMQYSVSGIQDPRFIPYNFAYYVLYPFYNDFVKAPIWADKNEFSRFLPGCPFPATVGRRIRGNYYDAHGVRFENDISKDYLATLYQRICELGCESIVIKAVAQTARGMGVRKYRVATEEDLGPALADWEGKQDFIIQKAVAQHPFFAQFNPDSTNIIRLTTWRHGNDVEVFAPCLRFGIPGSSTDVAFVNGVEIVQCVGIDREGRVAGHGIDLAGNKFLLDLANRQVPMWDEIVRTVKQNHLALDYFDIVAWDVTVDSQCSVVCFEYNIRGPGVIVYQFAHGPLAGEHTDAFLSFLRESKNRQKYLPRCIQG